MSSEDEPPTSSERSLPRISIDEHVPELMDAPSRKLESARPLNDPSSSSGWTTSLLPHADSPREKGLDMSNKPTDPILPTNPFPKPPPPPTFWKRPHLWIWTGLAAVVVALGIAFGLMR